MFLKKTLQDIGVMLVIGQIILYQKKMIL